MAPRPTDLHRVYIQTLLSRRYMREEIALELYRRAISAVRLHDEHFRPTHAPDANSFNGFLGEINDLLEVYGMSVQRGREDTKRGKGVIALVNSQPTETGLAASDYAPNELAYFRSVVTEIIESYPGNSVGSREALRISSDQEPKMSKSNAEVLLGTFVSRGWLLKSKRGRYSIAPRAMLELEPWLLKEFEEYMNKCPKCSRYVMSGVKCSKDDCETHLHHYCYNSIVHRMRDKAACSSCKTAFTASPPDPIGEKAIPRAEDTFKGNSKKKRKSQGKRARLSDDEEDEDDDEADLEEEAYGASQSQTQAGPSGRQKRVRQSYVPDTQYEDEE